MLRIWRITFYSKVQEANTVASKREGGRERGRKGKRERGREEQRERERGRRLGLAWTFKTSKPSPSDILPPIRPHFLVLIILSNSTTLW